MKAFLSQSAKSKARQNLLTAIALLFLIVVIGTIFKYSQNSQLGGTIKKTLQSAINVPTTAPTPSLFPFYELTIPYLRAQTYKSTISDLNLVAEYENYSSYQTSYQSDGLKINALLTKPTGQMPKGGWPAILFIHGYIPPKQYATLGKPYASYVDYLARNGFVIFKIDLRGHGDSQGEPGGAYYSSDYVIDALNAYASLQHTDFVNSKKIGIWGHSMAGNITLRTLASRPEIPAAVIWAGAGYTYTDLGKYKITDASYDPLQSSNSRTRKREQIRKLYGDADLTKPFWQQLAPTSYLTDLKGVIELHHADDDAVVDVRYSRDLDLLLERAHVGHEFFEYPSGGHNISGSNFTIAMERTVEFFKKHLQ